MCHVIRVASVGVVAVMSGAVSLWCMFMAGSVGLPSFVMIRSWLFKKSITSCPLWSGIVLLASHIGWCALISPHRIIGVVIEFIMVSRSSKNSVRVTVGGA